MIISLANQSCLSKLYGKLWDNKESSKENGPDSSVGRASAFGAVGRGFESRPHHTKGVKNGNSSSLADARIKWVVLGR